MTALETIPYGFDLNGVEFIDFWLKRDKAWGPEAQRNGGMAPNCGGRLPLWI